MTITASPSTSNYQIGKGKVYVSLDSGATWRDVGNVTALEWTPNVSTLDHYSSQAGVKTKDKTVVIESGAKLKMTMDEITADNLALMALGSRVTESDGDQHVVSMTASSVRATVRFEGQNDVGAKVRFIGVVDFTPSGSFKFISEEWNEMEVTGDMVLDATYGLGMFTFPA